MYRNWIEGGSRVELTVQCCSRTRTGSIELQTKGLTVETVGIILSLLYLRRHKPVSVKRICTVLKDVELSDWLLDLQFHSLIDQPCSFCSKTSEHHLMISPAIQVTSTNHFTVSISSPICGCTPQSTQAPIATKAPTKPIPPALAILSAAAA